MARLHIEPRADGSLLLTHAGGPRPWYGIAGVGAAVGVLSGVTSDRLFAAVVLVPLAVIALLAGLAAARHRDWVLFDRRAREIVFRRGLASIFRPVGVVSFDDVEAILVDPARPDGDDVEVQLLRAGDLVWPLETSADPEHVSRLVTALETVGRWPVVRGGGCPAR